MKIQSFGELVEKLRKDKDMTIYELADVSGLSTVEISNIENNKHRPRPSTLHKLSEALEYDYMDLYNASQNY